MASCEWATPQPLFDLLDSEFNFELDVCATRQNAKCIRFFTKRDDGLKRKWFGVVWMNPPYGLGIEKWMAKAYATAQQGYGTVVALIPTRTNSPWWHDFVLRASEIRFIRKKVSFEGPVKGVAFTGHAVVVFRPGFDGGPIVSSQEQKKNG